MFVLENPALTAPDVTPHLVRMCLSHWTQVRELEEVAGIDVSDLRGCCSQLPKIQQEIVLLRLLADKTAEVTETLTGVSLSEQESLIHAACVTISTRLSE